MGSRDEEKADDHSFLFDFAFRCCLKRASLKMFSKAVAVLFRISAISVGKMGMDIPPRSHASPALLVVKLQ